MNRLSIYKLVLLVTLMISSVYGEEIVCNIVSVRPDAVSSNFNIITFTGNSYTNYKIYWKDNLDSPWDAVDYPALQEDISHNTEGTVTWVDRGRDPQMQGNLPGQVPQRFYRVTAQLPTAKHIILIIGDGMHLQNEIAASRYRYGTDYGLVWHEFPYSGFVTTWDVDTYSRYAFNASLPEYDAQSYAASIGYDTLQGGYAPYPIDLTGQDSYFLTELAGYDLSAYFPATDSASAATAMATGFKTNEGNISWLPGDPDNGALLTVAEKMRIHKGFSIGVVSTMPFSHATPAAFVSHNKNREHYYTGFDNDGSFGIADEIVTVIKPDIVIGGGHPLRNNPTWDITEGFLSQSLYTTLVTSGEYIFAERQLGVDGGLTISNAAQQAVTQHKKLFGLFGGYKGYFEPQIASDTPGAPSVMRSTKENPTLSDCALAALTVASRDNDGFFLMIEQGDVDTANHYNDFRWMIASMWDLEEAVKTVIDFIDRPDDAIDWSNTLLIITSDHANSYMRLSNAPALQKGDLPGQEGSPYAYTYPDGEVSYHTNDHTNELVTIYAQGDAAKLLNRYKGSCYDGTQIIDNTEIYQILRRAVQIDD